ncbi:uncharacterized protein LOC134460902 [Engraulis encrasicolus]|uniref:uncharacterized protein LOC134460902 n=1 Tax=Engraulis encrasicolus TaxID=184585 RepID=UPI002FD74D72
MDLSGKDPGPPEQPAEGSPQMEGKIPAGTTEASDAHTVTTKPDKKKGEKEKVKNQKGNGKERKSGGWRATLLRCFVCGGGGDSHEEREMAAQEERLRIEERIRKAREADLQKFLKVRKVNIKHRVNFKRMLRRRKMTEANKEWSALPPRPEEEAADGKVSFREVDACDVWFYQEEANPRLGQAWKRVLQEIKNNEMARALQAKWLIKEKQLMKTEKKQEKQLKSEEKKLIAAPQMEEEEIDLFCEILMAAMLCLGFGVLLYLWLSLLE